MFTRTALRSRLPAVKQPAARFVSSAGAKQKPADKELREQNRPASETTGTDPKAEGSPKESTIEDNDPNDNRHPAQQPDPQVKPTRSTGIGEQRGVSKHEKAG